MIEKPEKTNLYLARKVKRQLKALADRRNVSMSECVALLVTEEQERRKAA